MANKGMNSCCTTKLILGIVIGLVAAVAIFCLVVAIGCAINGISFGQQIANWFGKTDVKQVGETVEQGVKGFIGLLR